MTDLRHGGNLLCHNHRMVRRSVNGGKYGELLRVGQQRRGPGDGFQHITVKVCLTTVTDPARNRQHEVNACVVKQFADF